MNSTLNATVRKAKECKKDFKKNVRPHIKSAIDRRLFNQEQFGKFGLQAYSDVVGSEWAEFVRQYDIYSLNLLSHVYNKNLEKALKYEQKILDVKAPMSSSDSYDYYTDDAIWRSIETLKGVEGAIFQLREVLEAEKVIKQHKEAAAKKAAKAVKGKGKKGRGKK